MSTRTSFPKRLNWNQSCSMNIFILAAVVGIFLPVMLLFFSRSNRILKFHLTLFISALFLQILTEALFASWGLRQYIKHVSIIFVSLRIFHLLYLFKAKINFKDMPLFYLFPSVWIGNLIFWSYVFARLTVKIL